MNNTGSVLVSHLNEIHLVEHDDNENSPQILKNGSSCPLADGCQGERSRE